jgi:glucose 1-dehydrogenase
MKAIAIFPDKKDVRLIEVDPPAIQNPTDVKIQILDVGVCGTDIKLCAFEHKVVLPPGSEYLIIGHEALGKVTEVGSQVTAFRPGDLVVPLARRPCDHPDCVACRSNRPDFCFSGEAPERGIVGLHGYMAEIVIEDEKHLNLVPPDLRDAGVLTEPLSIAEKAMLEVWQIQARLPWALRHDQHPHRKGADLSPSEKGRPHNAVVLGAGPISLLGASLLRAANFNTTVYSRKASGNPKSMVAQAIGAAYVEQEKVPMEKLAAQVGNIDLIYEGTGASELSFTMMQYLGNNGIFVFTGIPETENKVKLNADILMKNQVRKNQVVLGTVNADKTAHKRAILDLAEFKKRWPDALKEIITQRYPVDKFAIPLKGDTGGIKNVIAFG